MRSLVGFMLVVIFLCGVVSYSFAQTDSYRYRSGTGYFDLKDDRYSDCGRGMAGDGKVTVSDVRYLKDIPLDRDGDGRWDALEVSVAFSIDQEANSAVLYLAGGENTLALWGAIDGAIAPGKHEFSFIFDGNVIRERGFEGPYRVIFLKFSHHDETDLWRIGCVREIGQTASYRASDFALPSVKISDK
ncbi:MAG: hypothetical protein HQL21_06550 [Candidatus Omnitrophica bacterium]|nr:hypothetical protein [Candidatus Omnitrophota bacterium]